MRLIACLAAMMLMLSCSTRPDASSPDYTPVADSELFTDAARVPGIEDADLSYNRTLGDRGYRGELIVDADLSVEQVARAVDTVYAILRQGRVDSTIALQVVQDNRILGDLPGVPSNGTLTELASRYGPQPGDGKPPS